MPTYDFLCVTCGYKKEDIKPMSFPKVSECPKCNKKTYTKLIGSGSGIIFKGEGFYETEYKKKDKS